MLSRSLALLPFLTLLACSPRPAQSPATVIDWAMGPQQLSSVSVAHHRLILVSLPALQSGGPTPSNEPCLAASAFLPALAPDPRIFFLVDGEVHARTAPGTTPVRLAQNDRGLHVTRMLAFTKLASPLEMLVAARPTGSTEEELWKLTLAPGAILSAQRVTIDLSDREAFFARYDVPRCLPGGRRCLVPTFDQQGAYVDEQATRDSAPILLAKMGDTRVADASWAAPEGSSLYLYLLESCSSP
jgi:hypothetical protein